MALNVIRKNQVLHSKSEIGIYQINIDEAFQGKI